MILALGIGSDETEHALELAWRYTSIPDDWDPFHSTGARVYPYLARPGPAAGILNALASILSSHEASAQPVIAQLEARGIPVPELKPFARVSREQKRFAPCALDVDGDSTERLLEELSSHSRFTRRRAIYAIGALPTPGARIVAAVMDLRDDPDAEVRRLCLTALTRVAPGDARTAESVARALDDPDADVRAFAAGIAGEEAVERDVVRETLLGALSDLDEEVRCNAASSLAEAGYRDIVVDEALARALRFDSSRRVRKAAATALREEKTDSDDVVRSLQQGLRDEGPAVITSAMLALVERGIVPDVPVVEILREVAADFAASRPPYQLSASSRASAGVRALDLLGANAIDGLIAALRSDEVAVIRVRAAVQLGRLGAVATRALRELQIASADAAAGLRQAASDALAAIRAG